MKQLTIAVPAYNMESLLPRCLSSLAAQALQEELEVVVVDDGSTDGTAAVAEEYQAKWPEIFTLVRQENRGHGGAVNAAMARATGRYFRIVDADDWVNTENLAALIGALRETDADLVLDEKTEVNAQNGRETHFPLPEDAPVDKKVEMEEIAGPQYRYFMAMHTMTVRRDLLEKNRIRLLENTFYVDMQYAIEASAFARSALLLRLGIYFYRVGDPNQSVDYLNYARRYDEHDRVLAECLSFYGAGEYGEDRMEFTAYSVALAIRTQYTIALIYNPNKAQGRRQARALREKLKWEAPNLEKSSKGRYWTGLLLNRLGIGYKGLNRLKRLFGRKERG